MRIVPVEDAEAVATATANRVRTLIAGNFRSDGGAWYGVLPKTLWSRIRQADEKNRVEVTLRLLLIQSEGKNILVDTGLGNRLDDKARKIFSPDEWSLLTELDRMGLSRTDIDMVVLTHLHHDHAGGIVSDFGRGDELTFPNAEHIIQRREWNIAKNPDALNMAAYDFDHHLKLLENSGRLRLVNGDADLTSEVRVVLCSGHSEGTQAVRIATNDTLVWYASDIISSSAHMKPGVCFAYDVSRRESAAAKLHILAELQREGGWLVFNHNPLEIGVEFRRETKKAD